MSGMNDDELFEAFLSADPYDVTDDELWRWMPQLLDVMAQAWGKTPGDRERRAMSKLVLMNMGRAEVVQAVLMLRVADATRGMRDE